MSENYTINIDSTTTTDVTYIGFAPRSVLDSAAEWRIIKIDESGTVTTIKWAGGTDKFDKVWNDRVSLSYS